MRGRVGNGLVTRLYEDVKDRPDLKPRRTITASMAVGMATVIHLSTLGLVVGAIWLGLVTYPNPVALVLSALMLAVAAMGRPRLGRPAKDAVVLDRRSAPTLYGLLDRVAAQVGARLVDVVVADHDFNAGYGAVGLRRRRVLYVGLPLWRTLRASRTRDL